MGNLPLDRGTLEALAALVAHGQIPVSQKLARAIKSRSAAKGAPLGTTVIDSGFLSAAALVDLSTILDVDLAWFFECDPSLLASIAPPKPLNADGRALLKLFADVKDADVRNKIIALAQYIANRERGSPGNE